AARRNPHYRRPRTARSAGSPCAARRGQSRGLEPRRRAPRRGGGAAGGGGGGEQCAAGEHGRFPCFLASVFASIANERGGRATDACASLFPPRGARGIFPSSRYSGSTGVLAEALGREGIIEAVKALLCEHEPRFLVAQHLKRGNALDVKPNTYIGYLDLLCRY